ncbi:MAG: isoaspartyl peptidase/L-asparaginase, partial [Gemmatimonadota bacterium]|nr:isoaspartyl peptidase/L-asparaginase [Gemmatimonadota bacterium]
VVEHMRQGKSPQEACEAVVQHLIARVPSARPYQMAYIAIDKYGNWGAAAARSGFLSAVTSNAENQLYKSRYIIGNGGVG